jgi:C-terminal processing protease CtpA/Prc
VNHYDVNRELRLKYGDNYREVWDALQQAEAQLIEKPDGRKVIKIISIEKGSIIDRLHFAVGDEIYKVNNLDFSDFEGSTGDAYNRGKELHQQLRNETEFQIEIERKGIPTVMRFTVPM